MYLFKKVDLSVVVLIPLMVVSAVSCSKEVSKPSEGARVLVFSKTVGYRHASIPQGQKAIQQLGEENDFEVDTTEDASKFTEDNLKKYAAVIFLSTTGDVLNDAQQTAFEHYIESGAGYVGIHSASDTEYDWPWYGQLVGAYFKEHPEIQQAKLDIHNDANFPVMDALPNPWIRTDEWYDFQQVPEDVNVLVTIDENSYQGGSTGDVHPMVWYHEFDGGRSFYIELGHTEESYSEDNFLKLLMAGINYAIGS